MSVSTSPVPSNSDESDLDDLYADCAHQVAISVWGPSPAVEVKMPASANEDDGKDEDDDLADFDDEYASSEEEGGGEGGEDCGEAGEGEVRKLNTSSIGRAKVSTILKPLPLPLNFEITPYTPFYGAPTNLEQPLPTWEDNPKYSNVKYRDTVNRELIRVIASREKPCDEIRTVVISKLPESVFELQIEQYLQTVHVTVQGMEIVRSSGSARVQLGTKEQAEELVNEEEGFWGENENIVIHWDKGNLYGPKELLPRPKRSVKVAVPSIPAVETPLLGGVEDSVYQDDRNHSFHHNPNLYHGLPSACGPSAASGRREPPKRRKMGAVKPSLLGEGNGGNYDFMQEMNTRLGRQPRGGIMPGKGGGGLARMAMWEKTGMGKVVAGQGSQREEQGSSWEQHLTQPRGPESAAAARKKNIWVTKEQPKVVDVEGMGREEEILAKQSTMYKKMLGLLPEAEIEKRNENMLKYKDAAKKLLEVKKNLLKAREDRRKKEEKEMEKEKKKEDQIRKVEDENFREKVEGEREVGGEGVGSQTVYPALPNITGTPDEQRRLLRVTVPRDLWVSAEDIVEHLEIFGENRVFVKPKFHKGGKDTWDDVYEGSIGLGAGRLSDLGKVIILVLFDEEEDSKLAEQKGGTYGGVRHAVGLERLVEDDNPLPSVELEVAVWADEALGTGLY